jgi:hypothetical protein
VFCDEALVNVDELVDVGGGSGAALFFKLPTLAAVTAAAAEDTVEEEELLFFLLVRTERLLPDPAIRAAAVLTDDPPLPLPVNVVGGKKVALRDDGFPPPPLLGLEPERKLSEVEDRERSCTGDSRPAKLGGRDRTRRSGVGIPF